MILMKDEVMLMVISNTSYSQDVSLDMKRLIRRISQMQLIQVLMTKEIMIKFKKKNV